MYPFLVSLEKRLETQRTTLGVVNCVTSHVTD